MLRHPAVGQHPGERGGLLPEACGNAFRRMRARPTPMLKLARQLVELVIDVQRGVNLHDGPPCHRVQSLGSFTDDCRPLNIEFHAGLSEAHDLSVAQRWMLKKVFDLGWTVERFGTFDRTVDSYANRGRSAHKPERIGKKYQWIAYHEFLAHVSDNFEYRGDSWSGQPEKYEGPWQITYVRDIDPSYVLPRTERERWQFRTAPWWFPASYNHWDAEPDNATWLRSAMDLPAVEPLLEVVDPADGSKWFVMETFYQWEQPTPLGEERWKTPRRQLWYMVKSYIVKKSDIALLFAWAKQQHFMGRWMPESHEVYRLFLGEFFWSPAFAYHNVPYYSHGGWTQGSGKTIPRELLVSTDQYMQESTVYDCSIDETVNIYLPVQWIVDQLGLQWRGVEGHFFYNQGSLIAFDPSVRKAGPGALLINRDVLLNFLHEHGYDVLWTFLGEKNIVSMGMSHDDWEGRLELSGAYRVDQNQIMGGLTTRFIGH